MRLDNAYAQAVRWRYRHIFVDEAQYMNPLQYELFEAIRGQRADVFIVGDPMQAIYGWNGSDKRLFDELPDKIRGTTVLRLPNNYRCTPEILNAATTVAKLVDPQIDVRAIKPTQNQLFCAVTPMQTQRLKASSTACGNTQTPAAKTHGSRPQFWCAPIFKLS